MYNPNALSSKLLLYIPNILGILALGKSILKVANICLFFIFILT